MHVDVSGRVFVPAPLEEAFALFTPERSAGGVPDWEPEYLHPADGTLVEGLTFRTRHDGEETLWLVSRCDAAAGVADYVRITPGSRIVIVAVRPAAKSAGATVVKVTYRLTSLSAAGDGRVQAFARDFPAMLASWEQQIAKALADARVRTI